MVRENILNFFDVHKYDLMVAWKDDVKRKKMQNKIKYCCKLNREDWYDPLCETVEVLKFFKIWNLFDFISRC